jgi:hypothetical protein
VLKPDFFCSAHCKKVEFFSNKAQDIQQPIGRHLLMYCFPNKVKPGKQKSPGYKGNKGIDTEEYKIYIPEERICKLKLQLNHALTRYKITLKELQSLAGSLVFNFKVLPSARAFNRRFYEPVPET